MPVIKTPTERTMKLDLPTSLDPNQDGEIKVRQATQREQERLAALDYETVRTYRDEPTDDKPGRSVDVRFKWTFPEQQRLQVYLTLAGCNIEMSDPDHSDKTVSLFDFKKDPQGRMRVNMTEQQFAEAWGLLSPEYVKAIYEKVLEVNPQWKPSF